jgi:hydroxymethylpyrimidine/phosphomethylpyrimidine kinase
MSKGKQMASAMTIAGSDSGGGAGVQADLKTFAVIGVHGTCAVTSLTAQNPRRVSGMLATPAPMVSAQIAAVLEFASPGAVKTGMLLTAGIIQAVAESLASCRAPLVIDPVMVSTSGTILLERKALEALEMVLIPRARLVTPNLAEAEVFLQQRIESPEELKAAARALQARWGCAVLAKGGHLRGAREAVDYLFDGGREHVFIAPFAKGRKTHGTGCAYSAAITAYLALGCDLPEAVRRGKEFVTRIILASRRVGRHEVLGFDAGREGDGSSD